MANVNDVTLIGTLTRDVELKATSGGTSVGKFSLAINEQYQAKDGTEKKSVTYVDCTAWGKTAENVAKYTGKGMQLYVKGALKTDTWEDKDGNKRYKTYVNVALVQFLGNKQDKPAAQVEPKASSDPTEDIPF
jgi:single-strand DNA-binding protein